MSPVESAWREFLAGHPEVRAMPGENVTKIKSVWLDGAVALLIAVAAEEPKDLETLKARISAAADEVGAELRRIHGNTGPDH